MCDVTEEEKSQKTNDRDCSCQDAESLLQIKERTKDNLDHHVEAHEKVVDELEDYLLQLESPFQWKPDLVVQNISKTKLCPDIIEYLTVKEKEFVRAKTNIFRESVVHLVLAYEKSKSAHMTEAIKDLQHCYELIEPFVEPSYQKGKETKDKKSSLKEDHGKNINQTGTTKEASQTSQYIEEATICQQLDSLSVSDTSDLDVNPDELFQSLISEELNYEWRNVDEAEMFEVNDFKKEEKPSEKSEDGHCCDNEVVSADNLERMYALECVVKSSLAYLAFHSGLKEDARELAIYVSNKFAELGNTGQAMILAIKGAIFCEYGYAGNAVALPCLQKALELDSNYWEWNLFLAKILGRLRRVQQSSGGEPTEEELMLLEKAMKLNNQDAACMVHLGNTYRILASVLYRKSTLNKQMSACDDPNLQSKLQGSWRSSRSYSRYNEWQNMPRYNPGSLPQEKNYLQLAKDLFVKALSVEPHCPYNNARCAKGLWSLPYPYKDKELAKKAILHAVSLAQDDSLVCHYAGLFYENCHDFDKAVIWYERATEGDRCNFPAEMSYINLKLKMNPGSYSPVFRLDSLLHKYKQNNQLIQTYCFLGYYFYRLEKQYLPAIRNFTSALKIDPSNLNITSFYPGQFYGRYPTSINILVLLEECLIKYEKCKDCAENKSLVQEAWALLNKAKELIPGFKSE